MIDFNDIQKVHFVGIGGIGVSAIARKMLEEGKRVTGSDASESELVDALRDMGANISVGHHADNIPEDIDLLIYSVAVPHENPELIKARELEKPALTYAEALGVLSEQYTTVAVSGTHGKTTTTAMLAEIAERTDIDPTVIVGSLLNGSKTNYVGGDGEYFIVEACEYKRSFLELHPDILVITNIDTDHLDYFENLADIQDAFQALVKKVPRDGVIICNPHNRAVTPVIDSVDADVVDYTQFRKDFTLSVPGAHNILNAQAAIAAAHEMGVYQEDARQSLEHFSGTWRRAEHKGETTEGAVVYDDYAHHPAEIKATLEGFRGEFPDKEMIVVFQPHLFSRTKILLDEFTHSFSTADSVVIVPIYAARETPDKSIHSRDLVDRLESEGVSALYKDDFDAAEAHLEANTNEDNLIITMGAGDIYKLAEEIVS